MDNEHAQILVGATTAVGTFEVVLYLKNLITAYSIKDLPSYYKMRIHHITITKRDDFESLRHETIARCKYEVAGAVLNCGLLAAKIWFGYYPIIWQATFERFGKWSFVTYWVFQLVDTVANELIFAPTTIQIKKSRGKSGVRVMSLARGHTVKFMPLGIIGLLIMAFATDVNPRIWFFLPLVGTFDDILLQTVERYRCKKLVESDPDLPITNLVREVAAIYQFPVNNIYKDPGEKEVPEANYYALGHMIIVSEKMLSLPEQTAAVLISQEIGLYTRRTSLTNSAMSLIRFVGLGFLMMESCGNDLVSQVFGFDKTPYPYVPMYLAYAYVWPVFSNILHRVECLLHSWNIMKADTVIHKSTPSQGVTALEEVAGQAEKYPIFSTWYSQLMRGYPTVARRVKNLDSLTSTED